MKVGIITKPNKKGQIVIPKEIRDVLGVGPDTQLHISARGRGIYVYPIQEIVPLLDSTNSAYEDVLEKTRGKWHSEKWSKVRKDRAQIETKASKRRKNQW